MVKSLHEAMELEIREDGEGGGEWGRMERVGVSGGGWRGWV